MKARTILLLTVGGLLITSARTTLGDPTEYPALSDETKARMAPAFSGDLNEVVKLSKAGMDDSVLIAFIQKLSVIP